MAVIGMRGTGDWGTDERPKNFREMILWRNPNGSAPLTALMSKMGSESTDDPEFAWWEEELNPIRLQMNSGAIVTATTTFTVDVGDAQDLVIGDVLIIEKATVTTYSHELVRVTAINSATEFEVERGAANTTATSIADDTWMLKVGNIFEEGSTSPRNPTKALNYTQIFKTTYRITNTAKATNTRTGDPIKNDKKRKMFDHSVALEQAFLFGTPYEDTSGTKPKRYTGGLLHFLGTAYNATSAPTIATIASNTTTGEDDLLDATYQMFDYNNDRAGDERLVLCGNGFLNYVNKWAKDMGSTRVNYDGIIDVWGMKLQRWVIPQGTLYLKTHPLMNINTRYTNGAFMIDPSGVKYRPLRGRDTKFKDNIQANDADEQKGQWLTEAGAEFHHLRSMRYIAIE
jgi:hypothetical protein